MNERIRELYEQARIHAKSIDADIDPKGWMDLYHQKFAELVVRECMTLCIKVENDVELSDYEGGFKDGALLCYQEIQEHFGVE